MSKIIPFKAVRPPRDKVHLVASRSYVTYDAAQLHQKLRDNPYSFIHIINPEFSDQVKTEPNSPERFELIRKKYEEFVDREFLIQEDEDAFYIYRQTTPEQVFTGIVCGVDIREYLDGKIKIHEHTLTSRVQTFTNYLDICDFNAEPVLLTFAHEEIDFRGLIKQVIKERPEYDFTTTNMNRHEVWIIQGENEIKKIQEAFQHVNELYIADGHHRMASSVNLGENRKARNSWTEDHICNYALAMLIPDDILSIQPFHRILQLEEAIDETDLIQSLEENFEVEPCGNCFLPPQPHQFGMRLKSGWYILNIKGEVSGNRVIDSLDPVILTHLILEPIFKIFDQKTDDRISFIPGKDPIEPFEKAIDNGFFSVLFTLYPVSPEELFAVSDAGEVMPPKSTYIEPKLRSGLTMMKLS
jgi:uncharacterized protein (DUF1015 family)